MITDHHWTDDVVDRPIFSTVIDARGDRGNIFMILGKARSLLREIEIPRDRIDTLTEAVRASASYDDAIALIELWFRVNRGDEDGC
jgi:hypothetical protein